MISSKRSIQTKNTYEIADILQKFLPLFCTTHKIHRHQFKVLNAITNCRTAKLGAHIDQCNHCKFVEISYNSCRDRHCPKCHGSKQSKWLAKQMSQLLPIPYFHNIFTLPHLFNDIFLCNKKILYNMLFRAAANTLNEFAADSKHFGGKTGHIGILHTWGQNLGYHIHIHFIVAGGGLSADQTTWVQKNHHGKFIFSVKAMQKVFKEKFISSFTKAHDKGDLKYPGELKHLKHPVFFSEFKNKAHKLPWIIYAKKPFSGPEQVLKYIGRYTHRVAISNQRIIKVNEKGIHFKYKDYRDKNKTKVMILKPVEFIRRYLMHILPYRFVKIRHGGFLAGGYKKNLLNIATNLIRKINKNYTTAKRNLEKASKKILEKCTISCPACTTGTMLHLTTLNMHHIEFTGNI